MWFVSFPVKNMKNFDFHSCWNWMWRKVHMAEEAGARKSCSIQAFVGVAVMGFMKLCLSPSWSAVLMIRRQCFRIFSFLEVPRCYRGLQRGSRRRSKLLLQRTRRSKSLPYQSVCMARGGVGPSSLPLASSGDHSSVLRSTVSVARCRTGLIGVKQAHFLQLLM